MACGATLKRTFEFDVLHHPSQATPIKRRCIQQTMVQTLPPSKTTKLYQLSPFTTLTPKLTKEEIAVRIGSELKRMQRRKELFDSPSHSAALITCSALGRQSSSHSSGTLTTSEISSDFPLLSSHPTSGASSPQQKDIPLFTFKQVAMICERMIQEQEGKLRENYEKVLSDKLSEQYEAFLRFNHDQLQSHFENAPMSYVS